MHSSIAQVASSLGLSTHGGTHRRLKAQIDMLALDTSHFRGSAWSRGETRETHPSVDRCVRKRMVPDSEVFVANAAPYNGTRITKRLIGVCPLPVRALRHC